MLVLDSEGQQAHIAGDKHESAHERRTRELAHDLESNSISVANDDKYDVSNLLNQMGTPFTAEQVQERLKKCNSRLHFIRSPQFPELTGVYLITDEVEVDPKNRNFTKKLKHICGMESGVMPEFSVIHKTKIKKPNPELFQSKVKPHREVKMIDVDTFAGETRGWRTVLIRLLHAGLISLYDVEQNFPPPSRDSFKWWAAINKWRT